MFAISAICVCRKTAENTQTLDSVYAYVTVSRWCVCVWDCLSVAVPFRESPSYSSRRRGVCVSPRRSLMRSASDNALDESLPAPSPAPSLHSLPPLEPDNTVQSPHSPQGGHTRSLRRHTRGHLRYSASWLVRGKNVKLQDHFSIQTVYVQYIRMHGIFKYLLNLFSEDSTNRTLALDLNGH